MSRPRRIGPRMREVADYVAANPGCNGFAAATHVAPEGSPHNVTMYGYATVHRARKAGLIRVERDGQRMRLYPVESAS